MTVLDFQVTTTVPPLDGLAAHIGNTPLLPLRRLTSNLSPRVQVWAKAEWFNPGGSVKDRPALNIIKTALQAGHLGNGKRLLDSTSGNMGISYATFGAALGIPVTLALPANASPERIMILKALESFDGNRTKAAEALGINPRTLRNKLHEYGMMGGSEATVGAELDADNV